MYTSNNNKNHRSIRTLALSAMALAFLAPASHAASLDRVPVVSVGDPVNIMVGRPVSARAQVVEKDGSACGFVILPKEAEAALTRTEGAPPARYSGRLLVCAGTDYALPHPGGYLLVNGTVSRVLSSRLGPVPLVWMHRPADD